jgi:hypothetical protein
MRYGRNVKGICGLGLVKYLRKISQVLEMSNDFSSFFWVSFLMRVLLQGVGAEFYQKN